MVRQLLCAISLFVFLPQFAVATPQLLFILDKTEIQLGHHIDAELYAIDLQAKLINIDLRGLEENFGVLIVETSEEVEDPRWPDQAVQLMQLKLYPRKNGRLTIPELNLTDIQSTARTILIKPGIKSSRAGDTNIKRNIKISSTRPWERQQVVIEVEVITIDTFVSLRSENKNIPGFEVYPLPASSKKIQRNGVEYSVLRIGWALFPLSSGQYIIDMPAIEYRKSGQTLRTYFLPKQSLDVKALPPYIPPTMPVGKINVSSTLESEKLLYPDTLTFWEINLIGSGVSPNWIPPVLRQIKSNADLHFLSTNSQRTSTASRDALHSQVLHRIPFKPLVNGRLNLPTLRLQYFDPDSGRIITSTHQPQPSVVLGMVWRVILSSLIFILLLWVGKIIYEKFCFVRKRNRLRLSVVGDIEKANTIVDMRRALNFLAETEGWPANMTLRSWASHWRSNFNESAGFDALMNQLSRACYNKKQIIDLEKFRFVLLAQLRSR